MDAAITCRTKSEFSECQQALRDYLRKIVTAELIPLFESNGVEPPRDERFSIELWLRNVRSVQRSLELWGSSVVTWSSYDDLTRSPIDFDSQYSAVEAYTRAGYNFRRNGREGSRWQFQLGVLIRLQEEPWYNLPVGVIMLSSSFPESDSSIGRLSTQARLDLQEMLRAHGTTLANPATARGSLGLALQQR